MGEVQYQLMTADPPVSVAAMENDSEVATLKRYYQTGSSGTRRVYSGGSVTLTFPGHRVHPAKVPTPDSNGDCAVDDSASDPLNCSVYLDERPGKWKCRHCNWTYYIKNSHSGLANHSDWQCRHCNWNSTNRSWSVNHGAANVSSEIQGTESANVGKNVLLVNGLSRQHGQFLDNERLSPSSLTSSNISLEKQTAKGGYRNGGFCSIEQAEKGAAESSMENMLEKQDTHDLYCPDCSSCIIRRVVLNRRTQNTTNELGKPVEEAKSEAPRYLKAYAESTHPADDQAENTVNASPDNSSGPAVNDSGNESEPDLFRCFRIFNPEEHEADDPAPATSEPLLEQAPDDPVQASRVPLNQTYMAEKTGGNGHGGGEGYRWEILRSVVFGGLVESITSLGIVYSAAGAGAATLNVLVLGMACLIGGLVIISCNLLDLRHDYSKAVATAAAVPDRYEMILGRRENFALHFIVAIMSFLVCGLLPTVTYGFSFETKISTDIKKEEKLIAAGSVSLVCIILLAIGKAYAQKQQQQQRKSYAATVVYFFSIWMATSGTCYLVGDLIKKLIL